jgi:hypothetical protein
MPKTSFCHAVSELTGKGLQTEAKMKINYEFVTGERLELDDSIDEIVIEMEVSQSRRNRTETRRHHSLESMQEEQPGYTPRQFAE